MEASGQFDLHWPLEGTKIDKGSKGEQGTISYQGKEVSRIADLPAMYGAVRTPNPVTPFHFATSSIDPTNSISIAMFQELTQKERDAVVRSVALEAEVKQLTEWLAEKDAEIAWYRSKIP